eukprot:jgi/Chlat1/8432/Chrsp80S07846
MALASSSSCSALVARSAPASSSSSSCSSSARSPCSCSAGSWGFPRGGVGGKQDNWLSRVKWVVKTQQRPPAEGKYGPWMGVTSGVIKCYWCGTTDGRLWIWNPLAMGLVYEAFGVIPLRFERVRCTKCKGHAVLPCPSCNPVEVNNSSGQSSAKSRRRSRWTRVQTSGFFLWRLLFHRQGYKGLRGLTLSRQALRAGQAKALSGNLQGQMRGLATMERRATAAFARRERWWPIKLLLSGTGL